MGYHQNFEEERRKLVSALQSEGLLRSASVIAAMEKVPREFFVPEALKALAYHDAPLPTEHGQTISAPHDSSSNKGSGETWSPLWMRPRS